MNTDEVNGQRELERGLAAWAARLDVELPAEVRTRLQRAVRSELEQWAPLRLGQPPLDRAVVRRVQAAVRGELATLAGEPAGRARHRGGRVAWVGALAPRIPLAAAVLALVAFGVSRYAGWLDQAAPLGGDRTGTARLAPLVDPTIERFVQAADKVWGRDPVGAAIRLDLDAIEETLRPRPAAGDKVERMIEDIGTRIDDLFVEPDSIGDLREALAQQTGAMG